MLRVLLIILALASTLGAVQITDDVNGFRVDIPDTLPKARVDPKRFPDTLFMYAEPERGGVVLQLVLLPEQVPQPPESSSPTPATGGPEVAVLWKGFTLTRHHRYLSAGTANPAVEISVDLPVSKRGIRISISGPVRRETELVGLFTFVLEHFEARTNWVSRAPVAGAPVPAVDSQGGSAGELPDSSSNATAGIAATIALVLGFLGGWWLRGTGASNARTPIPEPTKPEPAPVALRSTQKLPPLAEKPAVVQAAPKKAPDETDPGTTFPKCRVCGQEIRGGRKVCMNCGSEVF